MAVWDGQPGDGAGGTASVVHRWQCLGLSVERIDLAEMLRRECPELAALARPDIASIEVPPVSDASDTRVMAMLFADAVGYSKLTEEQVPRFVQHFMGAIAELLRRPPSSAVVRNTWGDGLYLVFETVRDAGVFALDLCREI